MALAAAVAVMCGPWADLMMGAVCSSTAWWAGVVASEGGAVALSVFEWEAERGRVGAVCGLGWSIR